MDILLRRPITSIHSIEHRIVLKYQDIGIERSGIPKNGY